MSFLFHQIDPWGLQVMEPSAANYPGVPMKKLLVHTVVKQWCICLGGFYTVPPSFSVRWQKLDTKCHISLLYAVT